MDDNQKKAEWNSIKTYISSKGASWQDFFKSWLRNPSLVLCVISNLAILFLPGLEIKTHAVTIIWIYIVQSLMIGVMHVFKLFFYKFAAPTRPTDWKNPRAIAIFFMFHYGFFHFVYSRFISPKGADPELLMQGAAIFGFALIINTMRNYKKENSGQYNANDFMFLPYVRIIPIHMAIILGMFMTAITGNFAPMVYVLVIIKTCMEVFLEYLQQLGISFGDLQQIKPNSSDETS